MQLPVPAAPPRQCATGTKYLTHVRLRSCHSGGLWSLGAAAGGWGPSGLSAAPPQTNVALTRARSARPGPPPAPACLLVLTMEGKSEVWYTVDLVLPPRQRSSEVTSPHFASNRGSRCPFWARPRSPASGAGPHRSTSRARFAVEWVEREEGDLDLRRDRRGGRGGRGGGGGEGEAGLGVMRLLAVFTPPPPPPLALPLCLSLPEEEEGA